MVRSPFAHAHARATSTRRGRGRCRASRVLTAKDLEDEWGGPLPFVWPVTEDIKVPIHWPLTGDKARYQGDAVAVVVAEARARPRTPPRRSRSTGIALEAVVDIEAAARTAS